MRLCNYTKKHFLIFNLFLFRFGKFIVIILIEKEKKRTLYRKDSVKIVKLLLMSSF